MVNKDKTGVIGCVSWQSFSKSKVFFLVGFLMLISLLFTTSVYATTNPIGYWKLDGNGLDSSGNGNDGNVRNVTWVNEGKNGTNGSSASFRDCYSQIVVPDNSMFSVEALTIEAWINTGDSYTWGTTNRIILDKSYCGLDREAAIIPVDYRLSVNRGSRSSDYIRKISFCSVFGNLTADVTYEKNTWHYIAVTVTKEGLITLYSDGKVIGIEQGTPMATKNKAPINIGNCSGTNDWYCHTMDGLIDAVGFYNRALSEKEIEEHLALGTVEKKVEGDHCRADSFNLSTDTDIFTERSKILLYLIGILICSYQC